MAQPYATYKQNVGLENGQTLGFRKGKGYYAKGQATDPFATFNEPTIAAKVKQIVGRLPAPQTDQQIQTQAQGMLDPVVQQITASINARAQAGGQAVGGYTDQLAKNLMGAQGSVDSAYAPAEQGTAATNAALADRLSGAGNATSDALAARLASIGSPDVAGAATGAVRQAGTGAGNALYANGSASLEQLLGNHASASDYAGKLPALARLSGLQQMGAVEGRAQADIRDQTAQVTAQLPSIVQNLRSQSDTRANNRATTANDLFQFLTGQNTTRATAKAGLVADQTKTDAAANAPDTSWSKVNGYKSDAQGNAIPDAKGGYQILPGWHQDAKGNVVKDKTPPKAKDTVAAKTSAIKSANTTVLSIITAAAKPVKASSGGGLVPGAATTATKPKVGSPAYYEAIHKAEAAILPLVSTYMTPAQMTRFVQRVANAYFKG